MTEYQLSNDPFTGAPSSSILRTVDGTWIPSDPANTDFIEYQAWLAAGNVPDPAPPYVPFPGFAAPPP